MQPIEPLQQVQQVTHVEPVLLELLPTSFLFKKGQRIRVAIYGADIAHFSPASPVPFDLHVWAGNIPALAVKSSTSAEGPKIHAFSRLMLPVVDEDYY